MSVPFKVDLSDKIVAITGAGGVICSEFARALAECGAKVALLDINYDAAKKVADEIGENAYAVKCNCLDKADIFRAKNEIEYKFGKVNFLINGAGGNNPKATTDNETMTPDLEGGVIASGQPIVVAIAPGGRKAYVDNHSGRSNLAGDLSWNWYFYFRKQL